MLPSGTLAGSPKTVSNSSHLHNPLPQRLHTCNRLYEKDLNFLAHRMLQYLETTIKRRNNNNYGRAGQRTNKNNKLFYAPDNKNKKQVQTN